MPSIDHSLIRSMYSVQMYNLALKAWLFTYDELLTKRDIREKWKRGEIEFRSGPNVGVTSNSWSNVLEEKEDSWISETF